MIGMLVPTPNSAFISYGNTHPPIESLAKWFSSHNASYEAFLKYMYSLDVSHIPVAIRSGSKLAPAWMGGAITPFDCLALYAMIQRHKPMRYVKIGSGMTTCFARQAVTDGKLQAKIISIDPQPR